MSLSSFEEEIIALTTAIFIAFYHQERANENLSLSAEEVAKDLTLFFIEKSWFSSADMDYHVNADALHHGFSMFQLYDAVVGQYDRPGEDDGVGKYNEVGVALDIFHLLLEDCY